MNKTIDTRKIAGECEHCDTPFRVGDVKCSSCGSTLPEPGVLTQRQKAKRDEELRARQEAARIKKEQQKLKTKKILKIVIPIFTIVIIGIVTLLIVTKSIQTAREEGIIYSTFEYGYKIERMGNNYKDTELYINEYKNKPIIVVGENAFKFNSTLKLITFSSNVKMVMDHSFYQCIKLEKIVFEEGVNPSFGQYSFAFCSSLKEVVFASTMSALGTAMFESTGVSYLDLPRVTVIPTDFARDCINLQVLHIKKETTYIEQYAFHNNNIDRFYYEGSPDMWSFVYLGYGYGLDNGHANIVAITNNGMIRYNLQSNETDVLVSATPIFNMSNFDIPSDVNGFKVIGVMGSGFAYTNIVNVSFPSTFIVLYNYAFANCFGLETISFPPTYILLSATSFNNCANIKTVYVRSSEINDKGKNERQTDPNLCLVPVIYLGG